MSYVRVSILGDAPGGEVWSINPVFDPTLEFPGGVDQTALDAATDAIAALTRKVDGNADAIATLTVKVDATTESVATLAGVANTAIDLATKTAEAVVALANAQAQANAQTNGQLARLATMLERHVSTGH